MKIKTKMILVSTIVTVAIASCKKEEENNNNNSNSNTSSDVTVATDNSLADGIFNDVQNISDQASRGNLIFYSPQQPIGQKGEADYGKSSCATITHDSISNPRLLTIDFGTTNCTCNDGKNRRGKIFVSYTGLYRDSASVHSITFEDYFVNDNQVLGTKTVTNKGHNSNGNLHFSIEVNGQIIKANNGGTISWISTRDREWTQGENTFTWLDDVYSITGSGSGTTANGTSYTTTITSPLVRALNCHWFESGIIVITPNGVAPRTINYGTSGCDANATVTIGSTSYPIILN